MRATTADAYPDNPLRSPSVSRAGLRSQLTGADVVAQLLTERRTAAAAEDAA